MLYDYFSRKSSGLAVADIPEVLFFTFCLILSAWAVFRLHDAVQTFFLRKDSPEKKPWLRTEIRKPDTWISLLYLVLFGIAWRPSVSHGKKTRRTGLLIALSGPLACFLLSVVVFGAIRLAVLLKLFYLRLAAKALFRTAFYTAVFSLFPLPPYDGGTFLTALLPERVQGGFEKSSGLAPVLLYTAGLFLALFDFIPFPIL